MITFEYGLLMFFYNIGCLSIGLLIVYFIINRRK